MSKTSLRKALADLSRDQLISLLLDLYSARSEAKEWLDFWENPDADTVLDKARSAIQKEAARHSYSRSKMRTSVIAGLIKDIANLGVEPLRLIDLRIFAFDQMVSFAALYGLPISKIPSLAKFAFDTLKIAISENIFPSTLETIEKILDRTRGYNAKNLVRIIRLQLQAKLESLADV